MIFVGIETNEDIPFIQFEFNNLHTIVVHLHVPEFFIR